MSVVTGVTLQMSCAEDYPETDGGGTPVERVNDWLCERTFGEVVSVVNHYGGSKHPQIFVFGAGFNYFPDGEFATFVMSLPWEYPENVVLLLQPEDGPTEVHRPPY